MINNTLIKKEEIRWSYRKKGAQVLNICTKLLFLFGFTALANVSTALANPTGGSVVSGSATISSSGKTETINQSTENAIINWNTFNIAHGETTKVNQLNARSTEIEEIYKSGQLSSIDGSLLSNGRIVIINPNGVIIGNQGNINTAGFIATSAALANSSVNPNTALTSLNFGTAGNANASVTNQGTITVADTGLVALVAPTVRNDGLITGNLSKIQLGAADTFGVDLYGDGLVSLAVGSSDASRTLTAENSGSIVTQGGQVLMTAAAAGGLVDSVINNTGVIEAQALGDTNGQVALTGTGANVGVSGTIDVSGANSAGTINIGGAAQGGSSLAQSANVDITPTAVLNANATNNGNGGNVIVWSSNSTNFQGKITATGGANGGNGGNVETSSGNFLNADGNVNATAANGTGGNWLLDPNSIDITNSGSGISGIAIGPFYFVDGGTSSGTSILNATTLQNAMNAYGGMDVTVTTHNGGDITVDAPLTATQSWVGLYLDAAGNINVNQAMTASGTNNYWLTPGWNNELAFSLNAGGYINITAPIVTNGNSFLAEAVGNITDTSTINTGIGPTGLWSHNGNISVGNITTTYGSIGLEADNGTITAGNLTMDNTTPATGIPLWTGPVGTGLGPVADTMLLIAKDGITTGDLTANSGAADASGAGQTDTITLTTTQGLSMTGGTGNISTGNISLTDQAGGTAALSVISGGTLAVNGSITDYVQDVSGSPVYAAIAPTTLTANGNISVTGGIAVSGLDPDTCCIASAATLDVNSATGNIQIGGAVDAQSSGVVTGSWGGTLYAPSTSDTTVNMTANKGAITLGGGIAASSDSESTSTFKNATGTANTAVDLSALNTVTVANGGISSTATAVGSTSANQTSTANADLTVTAGGTISLNGAVVANSSVNTQNKKAAANSNANVDIESSGSELYFSQAAEANATSTNGTTPTSAQQSDSYNGVNYVGTTPNGSNNAAVTLKGVHTITVTDDATKVYGTNDKTATNTLTANFDYVDPLNSDADFQNTGSATSYLTGVTASVDRSVTLASQEQVGSYTINFDGVPSTLTGAGGNKFNVTNSGNSTLTIDPAALTIEAASDSKVYDGTTNSSGTPTATTADGLVTNRTVDGIVLNDTVTGTQAFASKDVLGTNDSTINVTSYEIDGSKINNDYNVTTKSATGTITRAQLTADITDGTSVYGNALNAGTATLNGVIGSDAVGTSAVTINTAGNTSTSKNLNAGTYDGIQSVTLTGTDAKDYTVVTATGTGNYTVTQRVLTASIADGSSTYGNAVTAGAVTLGNVVGDDKVTSGTATVTSIAANQSSSSNLDAGSYTQSVAAGVTGVDAKDYTFAGATSATKNYTVNQRTLTVASIATGSSIYGDPLDPGAATLTNVVKGDTVTSAVAVNTAGNTSTSGNLNAGNFTGIESVTGIAGTDAANYKLAVGGATGNYDVAQRALTGAIADNSSTYGDTVNSGSVALGNVVTGDNVSGSVSLTTTKSNYSTSNNLDAGNYAETASISGTDAKDYTYSGSGTYTVNQRALTATIADGSSTYGDAVNAGAVTLGNVVGDDVVTASNTATVTGPLSTSGHLDAGSYNQTVAGGIAGTDAKDYTFAGATSTTKNYTVGQLALTATIADGSSTYGSTVTGGAVTFGNAVGDDVVTASNTATVTGPLSTSGHLDAGSYVQSVAGGITGTDAKNYTFSGTTTSTDNYTVGQLALTATIADGSSTYGSTVTGGAVAFTNAVGDDVVTASNTATVTGPLSTSGHLDAGSYNQTVAGGITGTDAKDYTFAGATSTTKNYTVGQLALTATIADGSSTYGSTVTGGAVTFGNAVGDDVVTASNTATVTGPLSTSGHLDAGSYNQTVAGGIAGTDANNYTFAGATSGTKNYTVGQLALTANIADGSSTYGDAVNAGAVTFTNAVGGDIVTASNTATVTGPLSTSGHLDAGSYNQTVAGGIAGTDANNYTFAGATSGTKNYTVGQLALTANIADGSSTYGDAVNAGAVTFTNAVGGDIVTASNAATVTGPLSTSGHLDAGSYNQTVAGGIAGTDANNYTFAGATSGTKNYTVGQLALTANIADGSSTYGDAVNAGAVTFTNAVGGDIVTASNAATVTGPLSTSGHLDAGAYTQSVAAGVTGTDAANYTFAGATSATSNYAVNARVLTGSIATGSSVYGQTLNTGAVTLGNTVSGDIVNAGTVAVNTTGNTSAGGYLNAGNYTGIQSVGSTLSGADAKNYTFAGATGDYTVSQAALTITASNASKTYGTNDPTLTYSETGLVSGDSINGTLTRNAHGTAAGENTGNYAITLGSVAVNDPSNYAVTFASTGAALTISPATLTVAANSQTITQGQTVPAGTVSYSGFVNGVTVDGVTINDTAASLTTPATVASAQSGTPTSGSYANNYTASGAVDANYSFTYIAGNLTVNAGAPAPAATTDFGAQNAQFDPLGRPIISVADQSINYYPYFQSRNTNPENINISIRGNDNGAGQQGGNLANIEPAAGGDDDTTNAANLANIEPAAGGNGPGPQGHGDFTCSKDFLDGRTCSEQ